MNEDETLTVSDAARDLDLSESGVRLLERKGVLFAIRTRGGMRLFTHREVQRVRAERAKRKAAVA